MCELRVLGQLVAAAAPVTWMNESGRAVGPLVRRFGIRDLTRLVRRARRDGPARWVASRWKTGGGLAGHKGLVSIRAHLRSEAFTRVRVGVGRPHATGRGAEYVLKRPPRVERVELEGAVARAADAVECFLEHGLEATMNRFNAV